MRPPFSDNTLSRRQVLRGVGAGFGLHLPGLMQAEHLFAEARAAARRAHIKSCILVFYYGGPSHLDTVDMKPDAPAEIRGEFKPISSTVPGLPICEHLPNLAKVMHKVGVIRSMHHTNRLHDSASTETLTGRQSPQGDREEFSPIAQFYPCYGALLS